MTIALYDHGKQRFMSDLMVTFMNSDPLLEVVYRSTSFSDAYSFCSSNRPDVLLVSTTNVEETLEQSLRKLKPISPKGNTVLMTTQLSRWVIPNMKALGIKGYFVMSAPSGRLIECIQQVYAGKMYCSTEVSSALLEMDRTNVLDFSKRERSIIKLLVLDHSSKEIAEKLCISVHTVVSYRKSILKKFNVKGTAGIVRRAMETGYA